MPGVADIATASRMICPGGHLNRSDNRANDYGVSGITDAPISQPAPFDPACCLTDVTVGSRTPGTAAPTLGFLCEANAACRSAFRGT